MNRKNFCIRFLMVIFLAILPHVTYAQWMCQPVRTCYVTNVSQGGETKTCWDRIECHGYPSGVTYSPINNTFSGGAPTPSGGGSAASAAAQERLKKVHACKVESIDRTKSCNKSAVNLHKIDSAWCSGAKWLGGALGVASGWAAVEGEGGATVILGGAGLLMYQKGDDCQTDMDRVLTASTAICATDQARRDLDCDAIK